LKIATEIVVDPRGRETQLSCELLKEFGEESAVLVIQVRGGNRDGK